MADTSYLDWPFFDDSHRQLAAALEAWAAGNVAELEELEDEDMDKACRSYVSRLGKDGFLRYVVPAAYGGVFERLDVRSLCLCRETLGRYSGLADFSFVMQGLGTGAISIFGTEEQKAAYLPAVAAGEKIAALAMSEENAGSDVANISTTAKADGNGYVLNGTKTWISNAGLADQYVVIARTGDAPGAKGLSAFIVDADAPGFSVSERIDVIAPHPLGTLTFEDCRIPASQLIGEEGQGFKIAMGNLDVFRSTVAAAALGFARRALDEALVRIQERMIFGQPLADYQLTQARIADMATEIDASALLIYRGAWTRDSGAERITREASMSKMYATEAAQRVIDSAVQLFGGMGVVSGMPVEKLYREVRALRIYEGTTEVNKLVIAGQVMRAFNQQRGEG
jgi:acyl-CoA dehydrogenase